MNIAAKTDPLPAQIEPTSRLLTAAEFQKLADVPPEVEWFANQQPAHPPRLRKRGEELHALRWHVNSAP